MTMTLETPTTEGFFAADPVFQSLRNPAVPFWLPILSNAAYGLFAAVYSPVFFKKMKQAENPKDLLDQRLGKISSEIQKKIQGKRIIWLHAVSVGEVMAVRNFAENFLAQHPQHYLVLTTVTPTGQKIAKRMEGERLSALYFPFDFTFSCRRFFEALKPEALFLAETEIWPNLLLEAKKFSVPVVLLNARLSEKSKRSYSRFGFLFRPLFDCLDYVLAQTEEDAARFTALGLPVTRTAVLGNMKFDNVSLSARDPKAAALLKQEWNFEPDDLLWVAGSTHPKEEPVLFSAYAKLKKEFPRLKLILAPRHIERSQQIAAEIHRAGLRPVQATCRGSQRGADVLVLDQLGVLKHLYEIADVVYVGGSLTQRGGQNPIEPASFRKAVVHGPHIFNFEKIYREMDQSGGALEVQDEAQLVQRVRRLLTEDVWRRECGERAYEFVRSLQGATRRYEQWVSRFLTFRSQERIQDGSDNTKFFPQSGGRL